PADRGDLVLLVVRARLPDAVRRHRVEVAQRVVVPRLAARRRAGDAVPAGVQGAPLEAGELAEVVVGVELAESAVDEVVPPQAVAVAVVAVPESVQGCTGRAIDPALVHHSPEPVQ